MKYFKCLLFKIYYKVRFGKITERIVATTGYNIPAEIEYLDRNNNIIGFWAYGYWHPNYPYKGD